MPRDSAALYGAEDMNNIFPVSAGKKSKVTYYRGGAGFFLLAGRGAAWAHSPKGWLPFRAAAREDIR